MKVEKKQSASERFGYNPIILIPSDITTSEMEIVALIKNLQENINEVKSAYFTSGISNETNDIAISFADRILSRYLRMIINTEANNQQRIKRLMANFDKETLTTTFSVFVTKTVKEENFWKRKFGDCLTAITNLSLQREKKVE